VVEIGFGGAQHGLLDLIEQLIAAFEAACLRKLGMISACFDGKQLRIAGDLHIAETVVGKQAVPILLTFAGKNARTNLQGITLAGGQRHLDTTLVVDHAAPGGVSRELFKAALDGDGKSVFQGKIVVQQAAQKTDGKMMTQALLLSEDAEMNAKPELEIFADDVVCGHGATAGALDEDLLFYLRSRGLPEDLAQQLLTAAFCREPLMPISDAGVAALLTEQLDRALTNAGVA
jgi:Fe-S cluster assembly protein SufD